jgi:hypothetical protein
MRRGHSQKMNYWMRVRVLMQGLTIVAFVGGVYRLRGAEGIWGGGSTEGGSAGRGVGGQRGEQELIDRAGFRGRLKKAEEAHRLESGSASGRAENERGDGSEQRPPEGGERRNGNGLWQWWRGSSSTSGGSSPPNEK